MAVVTFDIEIPSKFSASKVFKAYTGFDKITPKVEPPQYESMTLLEGDGGVGSIVYVTYGDGFPFTSSKHKIDIIDKNNHSLGWTVFDGDVLQGIMDSVTHLFKLIPCEGGCVYKHTLVVKSKGDAKVTDDIINPTKQAVINSFKVLDTYLTDHPEAF